MFPQHNIVTWQRVVWCFCAATMVSGFRVDDTMPSDGNIEAPSFQQIEGQLRNHEVLETKPSLAATNPVRRVIRVGRHLGRFADSVSAKKESSKQKQTASVDGQNLHQSRTTSHSNTWREHQSPDFAVRDEKHMDAAQGQDVPSQKSESFVKHNNIHGSQRGNATHHISASQHLEGGSQPGQQTHEIIRSGTQETGGFRELDQAPEGLNGQRNQEIVSKGEVRIGERTRVDEAAPRHERREIVHDEGVPFQGRSEIVREAVTPSHERNEIRREEVFPRHERHDNLREDMIRRHGRRIVHEEVAPVREQREILHGDGGVPLERRNTEHEEVTSRSVRPSWEHHEVVRENVAPYQVHHESSHEARRSHVFPRGGYEISSEAGGYQGNQDEFPQGQHEFPRETITYPVRDEFSQRRNEVLHGNRETVHAETEAYPGHRELSHGRHDFSHEVEENQGYDQFSPGSYEFSQWNQEPLYDEGHEFSQGNREPSYDQWHEFSRDNHEPLYVESEAPRGFRELSHVRRDFSDDVNVHPGSDQFSQENYEFQMPSHREVDAFPVDSESWQGYDQFPREEDDMHQGPYVFSQGPREFSQGNREPLRREIDSYQELPQGHDEFPHEEEGMYLRDRDSSQGYGSPSDLYPLLPDSETTHEFPEDDGTYQRQDFPQGNQDLPPWESGMVEDHRETSPEQFESPHPAEELALQQTRQSKSR